MESITDTSSITKPGSLGETYLALRKSQPSANPLMEKAIENIWKQVWAQDATRRWLDLCDTTPTLIPRISLRIQKEDPEALAAIKSEIERIQQESQKNELKQLCRGFLALVNERLRAPLGKARQIYSGYACAGIKQQTAGEWLAGTAEIPTTTPLPPKTPSLLLIWFQPGAPEGSWSQQIKIQKGLDDDFVEFGIEVDCPALPFIYGRKRIRFVRELRSPSVSFPFLTIQQSGTYVAKVQILQGEELISSLDVIMTIGNLSDSKPEKTTPWKGFLSRFT